MNSQSINQLLNQLTPWGLTIGQTTIVVGIALLLLVFLGIARFFLRLGGFIFRLGCMAILLFSCGLIAFMLLSNNLH